LFKDISHEIDSMNIFTAIYKNNIQYIKNYISCGNDINIKHCDSYGLTPIMLAVRENNINIVQLLLEYGCDLTLEDEFGNSTLCFALESLKKISIQITYLLIDHGHNIDFINYNYLVSPIHGVIRRFFDKSTYSNHHMEYVFQKILILIQNGVWLHGYNDAYKKYLCKSNFYLTNAKNITQRLHKSFIIRYSKLSLLKLCVYIINTNRNIMEKEFYKLNRDCKKLIDQYDNRFYQYGNRF